MEHVGRRSLADQPNITSADAKAVKDADGKLRYSDEQWKSFSAAMGDQQLTVAAAKITSFHRKCTRTATSLTKTEREEADESALVSRRESIKRGIDKSCWFLILC